MKNIFKTLAIVGLVAASTTSCKKYLDVNTNPNQLTSASPDIILPQALAGTAAMSNTFNATYGSTAAGFMANGGGVSGFGDVITFNYSSGYATGLWSGTYDNLQDYQYVLNQTQPTGNSRYLNAIARTMKAFAYLRLVDAYGDVPYSQALKGTANLLPAYDKAEDVYKACITELNTAITSFKVESDATTINTASGPLGSIDITKYSPVTGTGGPGSSLSGTGLNMTNWVKFANTIKLRALIRIQKVSSLASFFATEKAALENNFTAADVLINPGYIQQSGKQNPLFNSWAYNFTGQNSQTSYIPASFVTGFYNGQKLTDDGRGRIIYRTYTIQSQLGSNASGTPINPAGGQWYTGPLPSAPANTPVSQLFGLGVMKGYDQGQPILLAAESFFLQAEAAMIGLIPGTSSTLFDQGVTASFAYLDKDHLMNISTTRNPVTEVATYKAANAASYLVNYNLATSDDQRLEAIITQKYIALNMLNCDEAWNEYRRTQYPRSIANGNPFTYMGAATVSNLSPRADRLAGRVLYPSSEYNFNSANVPVINTFTSLVFWDSRPR
ncbi:SusD/RagB family nutrient-binding outer membrane lipoprotein [Mucilaginibacter myungsuensis]|uniref:SusD/RagB family nutrient-binding outer membrane lipoprotein n=1 Tax=Mucilaginibacter myungsuensis TaxID=649104 RepID=A0A929PZ80_9SPHI|nr:SusD/RagB family nutrient-binding outer membrane lipoprotein [Mucilaginibacter myungsuensis]MBE9664132.1 SusD/RagB family nutrient-binding outer membrane lipoprotein [Mucilaginibacter myungsuensis]MDN3601311.1 SusD/RagB family nutrient-binding outer membrane lipoprotein [Mucilaginibacter myungsuensis]